MQDAGGSKSVWVGKLTRREFRERRLQGELSVCLIPVAATEQHLEHLAMEHDYRSCLYVAEQIALRLTPHVALAPLMHVGISEHHMKHPGTLTASPGSWIGVVWDGVRSAVEAGFDHVIVLNGHGGNIAPMEGVWSQFLQRYEANLFFKSYWEFVDPDFADACLETGRFPGHAQEFETAIAMAIFPENVRMEAMSDQLDQEPRVATAEAGQKILDHLLEKGGQFVDSVRRNEIKAEIPPFH